MDERTMMFSSIWGISRVAKYNRRNKNKKNREYLVLDTHNYDNTNKTYP